MHLLVEAQGLTRGQSTFIVQRGRVGDFSPPGPDFDESEFSPLVRYALRCHDGIPPIWGTVEVREVKTLLNQLALEGDAEGVVLCHGR